MHTDIVITTIFHATEAVRRFSELPETRLIVVGDAKTPAEWSCPNATFLSFDAQQISGDAFAALLPVNHYSRKMLGYLEAIKLGSVCIADTDDDNIPKSGWGFPEWAGTYEATPTDLGFINVYRWFTKQRIWPRGYPLRQISELTDLPPLTRQPCRVAVWQGLADGDPDVDAIYRLTSNEPCVFSRRDPIVLQSGTLCPFNSQNTLFTSDAFPLLYLPAHVTFRFTDILRGLVAQPILWAYEASVGFVDASVVQLRNPHDYFRDFISEIPMYSFTERVVEVVAGVVTSSRSIADNLFVAYEALHGAGIVEQRELGLLRAWLAALEAAKAPRK